MPSVNTIKHLFVTARQQRVSFAGLSAYRFFYEIIQPDSRFMLPLAKKSSLLGHLPLTQREMA
jgi:hypothetical protein